MTDRDQTHLNKLLQPIATEWLANCAAVGLKTEIIVTWRNPADQNAAKAEGLSNAAAGQSPHNICDKNGNPASCAFDFGIFESDGSYVTDGTDPRYAQGGAIGKALGLVYGGDWLWPCFKDYDHLELESWKQL